MTLSWTTAYTYIITVLTGHTGTDTSHNTVLLITQLNSRI